MPEKSIQQYVWDPDVEGALEQITDTFAHRIHPDQQTRVYLEDPSDLIQSWAQNAMIATYGPHYHRA